MLLENFFGLTLLDQQKEFVRSIDSRQVDMGDLFATGKDVRALRLQTRVDEPLRDSSPHPVEQLERPRPHRNCLRFLGSPEVFVDDPNRQPVALQLRGHSYPDWTRP